MRRFRYKSILHFGTLQFDGNHSAYFRQNTEKLVVYYVMPRKGKVPNMVRLYIRSKLIEEKKFYSPSNFFLCYFILYINFVRILMKYFSGNEKFYVICGHPLFSFFKSILKIFRNYELVYFVGDYYPGHSILNIIYRTVFNYYHKQIKYRIYISDRLNEIINGKVINNAYVKTIMWGVKPPKKYPQKVKNGLKLCFIGTIRQSHGLEIVLEVLKERKNIQAKILGPCEDNLFRTYLKIIKEYGIEKQVYFPNKFYDMEELAKEVTDCHIGVAFYDVLQAPYYSDPGKVKTYAQLGLPILMTDAAQIVRYIVKFNAGEIVQENVESIMKGIDLMTKNYPSYIKGLKKFNSFFNYKKYYEDKFSFLEN